MQSSIEKAARLAKWLIEVKKQKPNVAYIIAVNKYDLPKFTGRDIVRKEYQKIKRVHPGQTKLLDNP